MSALNHTLHGDDNGYDKNGNKINDNGGDEIDYLYDDLGNITDSKLVQVSQSTTSEREFRMYGIKVKPVSGALYDPSWDILELYAGGKILGAGLSYLGKGISSGLGRFVVNNASYLNKGNWVRLGVGTGKGAGMIRLSIGAHKNYINQVPKALRPLNQWLRNNIGSNGHIDFPNWKW